MLSQNITSCASTVVPLDHFQPFIVIVTVLPLLLQTGVLAVDKAKSTVGSEVVT